MKLSELLFGVNVLSAIPDMDVSFITSDSKRVKDGAMFVCLQGLHFDGHDYVREAVERGASVIIAQKNCEESRVPVIYVQDTHSALAHIWNNYYGRPSQKLDIIGITGTNGKTSTAYFLREIFSAAGYKTGLVGTVDCFAADKNISIEKHSERYGALANMTTPDPESLYKMLAIMVDEGVEVVFMEATSHALALSKLDPIKFKFGIFTNLTPDHLDFHGNMEEYFAVKAKLFNMCDVGIVNLDDPYAKRLCESANCKIYTVSDKGLDADFCAEEIKSLGALGLEYLFTSKKDVYRVKTPIPGDFTVKNTLLAASLSSLCRINMTVVQDSLKGFFGVPGRMERVRTDEVDFSVFIDYAHTPDALESLLESVRRFCTARNRLTLVFGCGGDRDSAKRSMMGNIGIRLADRVIITSDNSRSEDSVNIIFDIIRGVNGKNHIAIADRREAIEYAVSTALSGEIIILAGKGHEKYEIKGDERLPFDEREIVREAIEKYHIEKRGKNEHNV